MLRTVERKRAKSKAMGTAPITAIGTTMAAMFI
jgi:hypothetical protein